MLQTVMQGQPTGRLTDTIIERIKGMKAGEMLTHDWLEPVIGAKRNTNRYRTVIQAVKRRALRQLNLALKSVPGVGYIYPTGFEQVGVAAAGFRRGARTIARSCKVAVVVSDERLPDANHRRARDHIVGQISYLDALARSHRKTIELTIGKPETAPRLTG